MERFISRKWVRWALIALIVVIFVPIPLPWNKTLNATELDSQGNILGTTQIPLTATRWTWLLMSDHLVNIGIGPVGHCFIDNISTYEFDHRIMEDFLSLSIVVMYTPWTGRSRKPSQTPRV